MSYTTGPSQWRAPIASQGAIVIADGKHEQAIDILARLKGKGIQPSDSAVIRQKKSIDNALALEEADRPWRFSEIFKNGSLKIRRRLILAIWLQAMQQLSGINILVCYFPHTLTTDHVMDFETSFKLEPG
ncbi:MAG: hypothetical protein Q9173_001535 [Seirophora scorigena]